MSGNITKLPKTLWGFYIKWVIKQYKWSFILFFILMILGNLEMVMFPLFQKWFFALFETNIPEGISLIEYAVPTLLLIFACFTLIDVGMIFRSVYFNRLQPKMKNRISEIFNNFIHNQSMIFWNNRMAGKVNSQINYVSNGIMSVRDLSSMIICLGFSLCGLGLVFQVNKYVALILVIIFIFRVIYSILLMKPMNRTAKESSDADSSLNGKIVDGITNFSIVKLFAGAKREEKYLKKYREDSILKKIYAGYIQRLFWAIPGVIWDVAYIVVLIVCLYLYSNGQIKVSEIIFTISIYTHVMHMISWFVNLIPDLVDKLSSASKAYQDLNIPIDILDKDNATDLIVKKGKIEFKNVYFKYRKKNVIDNLSLVIKPGEKVGIVGPSGAGKTTLVNLILRLYDANKGNILIDGQNIKDVKQDSIRENISFIPQDPTMFNRTLKENISYGKPDATDKEIKNAAKKAEADKFIISTEKKYDSYVGDRGIKLSGGQKQRVAIARAFLKDSKILILDEATSALDSETEVSIQKSFNELSKGKTTIAIAHRLSTLRNMDRIIVLKEGKIIEQGSHKQLLKKKCGEYNKLWKMQSGGFLQDEQKE